MSDRQRGGYPAEQRAWPERPAPKAQERESVSAVDAPTTLPAVRRTARAERWAVAALLVATAVLYLYGLGRSGWANSFYAAAVQAGTKSWKAFVFGASDSSSFITVDKTPGSLWIMDLSARVFGLSSWSILVPQALEGVASVGVLYLAIRRWFSFGAALLAGAVLALTPVAALMFRFNNPDALLVLLTTCASYAVVRTLERASTRWIVLAGTLVGFAFMAKMLQALLVVPAFALVYLIAAPTPLRRRLLQLAASGTAMLVAGGWWVAMVQLWPAGSRPYIGGSQDNSVLSLMFGYNGFGRLTGNESGSVGGAGPVGNRWGPTGLLRLFNPEMGGQISWLLPAALLLLVLGLVITWRAPRTDRTRASLLLWGGTLAVTGVTFSLGAGIIHPYYTVALAPPIGALVGIGGSMLWQRRAELWARVALAAAVAVTALWAARVLGRTPDWNPALRPLLLMSALVVVVAILSMHALERTAQVVAAMGAAVVVLSGPAAYAVSTANTAHEGAIPSAGPAARGSTPFSRGLPGPGGGPTGSGAGRAIAGGALGAQQAAGGFGPGGAPGGVGAPAGGPGGILRSSTANAALVKALRTNARSYRWVAATVGSNQASGYQLASDEPVMAIGGFNGTDPAPTLTQFEQLVRMHRIHYFIAGGGFAGAGGPGGAANNSSSVASQITAWVEQHATATTVGGTTVYDLSLETPQRVSTARYASA